MSLSNGFIDQSLSETAAGQISTITGVAPGTVFPGTIYDYTQVGFNDAAEVQYVSTWFAIATSVSVNGAVDPPPLPLGAEAGEPDPARRGEGGRDADLARAGSDALTMHTPLLQPPDPSVTMGGPARAGAADPVSRAASIVATPETRVRVSMRLWSSRWLRCARARPWPCRVSSGS